MIAPAKQPALAWMACTRDGKPAWTARTGKIVAYVWHVGGEIPWRSEFGTFDDATEKRRIVSHAYMESAQVSTEKRIRKATS